MKSTKWQFWVVSALLMTGCMDGRDSALLDEHVGIARKAVIGGDSVFTGRLHTCAVLDTGAVRCWGEGLNGKLGYGNTDNIGDDLGETPAVIGDVDVGGNVVEIAAGHYQTCALLDTGAVRCWGGTYSLGYGNNSIIGDDETPASAGDIDLGGSAVQIAAGSGHTCALLDTGAVRCWGLGAYGALGLGIPGLTAVGDNETPASYAPVDVGGTVTQITAGFHHTCALLTTGNVRCWGFGSGGRLGYGNTSNIGDNETPASAGDVDVGGTVVYVDAGGEHTCALLDTGAVRCWGVGSAGRLGYGNTSNIGDNETPASAGDVALGGGTVTQLIASDLHSCVLYNDGNVRCWGAAYGGQLGYGSTLGIGDNELPTAVGYVPVGAAVAELSVGLGNHTCAMTTSGMTCWGANGYGQLGGKNINPINDNPYSIGDNEPASEGSDVDYR